jgi:hypothetical protein
VAFCPDGRWLAAASDFSAHVIDMSWVSATGQIATFDWIQTLHNVSEIHFDSRGCLVTLASPEREREEPYLARDVVEGPKDSAESWIQAILSYKSELPERRTTSPWTRELLIHGIGRELIAARVAASIAESVDIAPWHPISPVSLARMEQDNSRQLFLAKLTLRRLREADESLYGRHELARYGAAAANWMSKMKLNTEAVEAAKFSLDRLPDDDALLAESLADTFTQLNLPDQAHRSREIASGKTASK